MGDKMLDRAAIIKLQEDYQGYTKKIKEVQENMQSLMAPRAKLMSQLNENQMVSKEMELLDDDSNVYKLVGPVLVKQEVDDAQSNVKSRVSFLQGEMERVDKQFKALETQRDGLRDKIMGIQETMQQQQDLAMAAAEKAAAKAQQANDS